MSQAHEDSPWAFFRSRPRYTPTPLVELPQLARRVGVARVYLKDESQRALGSFKSLGGMYAGLRALVRAAGVPHIEALLAQRDSNRPLPALLCASDGNHGLAVAAGAELAGVPARVYLHRHVPLNRAQRIARLGAEIVWIEGTYDDAVDEARRAAERGAGLLIADTATDPDDPVVADVMAGYQVMAQEIVDQLAAAHWPPPTHLFVQGGVGGLAAALARGLAAQARSECRTIVVEPERVACIGAALRSGRIERLSGDLQTVAEMLSCGEASAPAMKILCDHQVQAITVDEAALLAAPATLTECRGPATTPSGATGVAGMLSIALGSSTAQRLGLDAASRVMVIVSEGPVEGVSVTVMGGWWFGKQTPASDM